MKDYYGKGPSTTKLILFLAVIAVTTLVKGKRPHYYIYGLLFLISCSCVARCEF